MNERSISMHVDLYLSSCIKLNSQWIKDLKKRSKNLHLIEEAVGNNNLELTDTRKAFLNSILITQVGRPRKFDLMNLKSFRMAKDTTI